MTITDKQAFDKYVETFGRVPSKRALEKFKATLQKKEDAKAKDLEKEKPESSEETLPNENENPGSTTPENPNAGGQPDSSSNTGSQDTPPSDSSPEQPAPGSQPEAPKSTISDKQAFDKYVETFGRVPSKRALEKFKATLAKEKGEVVPPKQPEADVKPTPQPPQDGNNQGGSGNQNDNTAPAPQPEAPKSTISDKQAFDKYVETFGRIPSKRALEKFKATLQKQEDAKDSNQPDTPPATDDKKPVEISLAEFLSLDDAALEAKLAGKKAKLTDKDTAISKADLDKLLARQDKLADENKNEKVNVTFANPAELANTSDKALALVKAPATLTSTDVGSAANLVLLTDEKFEDILGNTKLTNLSTTADNFKALASKELALLADGNVKLTDPELTIQDVIALTNLKEKLAPDAIKLVKAPASQLDALADFVGADKFESIQLTDDAITLASFKDVEDSPIKDKLVQPLPPLADTLANVVTALKDQTIASKLNATDEAKKVTITDLATARTDKDGAKILFANKDKLKADTKVGVDVEVDEVTDLLEDDSSATGSVLDVIKDQGISLSDKDTATATPETLGEIKKLKDGGKLLDGELVAKVEVPLSGVAGFVAKEAGNNGVDLKDLAADGAITITETTAPATKAQILAIASLDAKLKAGQKFPAKMTFADFKEVVENATAKALLADGEVIITDSLGGEDETKAQLTADEFNLVKANKTLLKVVADDQATADIDESLLNKFNVEMDLSSFKTLTTEDLALLADGSVTISANDKSQAISQADLAELVADNRDAKLAATEKFKASLSQDDIKDASKFTAQMAELIENKGLSISDATTPANHSAISTLANALATKNALDKLADDSKLSNASVSIAEFTALFDNDKKVIAKKTLVISDKDTNTAVTKDQLDAFVRENVENTGNSILEENNKLQPSLTLNEAISIFTETNADLQQGYITALKENGTTISDADTTRSEANTVKGMTTLNALLGNTYASSSRTDKAIKENTKFYATIPLDEAISPSNKTNIIAAVKDGELSLAPATAAVGAEAPTEVVLKNSDLTYFTADDQLFAKLKKATNNDKYKAALLPKEAAELGKANDTTNKNDNKKMLIAQDSIFFAEVAESEVEAQRLNKTELDQIKALKDDNKLLAGQQVKVSLSLTDFIAMKDETDKVNLIQSVKLSDAADSKQTFSNIQALSELSDQLKAKIENPGEYKMDTTIDQFKTITTGQNGMTKYIKDEGIIITDTALDRNFNNFKTDFLDLINTNKPELKAKLDPATKFESISSATIDNIVDLDTRTADTILNADTVANKDYDVFKFIKDNAIKAVAKATGDLTLDKFVKLAAHADKFEADNDNIIKQGASSKEVNLDTRFLNLSTGDFKKLAANDTLYHFVQDGKIKITNTTDNIDKATLDFLLDGTHKNKLENMGADTFAAELKLTDLITIVKGQDAAAAMTFIKATSLAILEPDTIISEADFTSLSTYKAKFVAATKFNVKFDNVASALTTLEGVDKNLIKKASIGDDDTTPNEVADKVQFDKIVAVKAQIADGEKFKFNDNAVAISDLLAINATDLSLLADAATTLKADDTSKFDSFTELKKFVDSGYATKVVNGQKFSANLTQNDLIDIKDKYSKYLKDGSVTISAQVTDVLFTLNDPKKSLKEEIKFIKDAGIENFSVTSGDTTAEALAVQGFAAKLRDQITEIQSVSAEKLQAIQEDAINKIANQAIKAVTGDASAIIALVNDSKFNNLKEKIADGSIEIENEEDAPLTSTDLKAIHEATLTISSLTTKIKDSSIGFVSVDEADFTIGIQSKLNSISADLKSDVEIKYNNAKGSIKLTDKKDVLKVVADSTDLSVVVGSSSTPNSGFATGIDKVDFSALNVTKEATKVSLSANKELATGKLYFLEDQNEAVNDASKLIAKFADKITVAADASVVVAVKDQTSTQLFKITNDSDTAIQESEVSVIGSIAGLDLGDIM